MLLEVYAAVETAEPVRIDAAAMVALHAAGNACTP